MYFPNMLGDSVSEKSASHHLVQRIAEGDESGVEELYRVLSGCVRATLRRTLMHSAVEDGIHEVLVMVLEAIRSGQLRDPARLMGFVNRVAHRYAVAQIRGAVFRRRRFVASLPEISSKPAETPEAIAAAGQKWTRAKQILRVLSRRDREILERFYLREEPREQICGEMQLTDTQFRLFKSRAISRCSTIAAASRPGRSESRIA